MIQFISAETLHLEYLILKSSINTEHIMAVTVLLIYTTSFWLPTNCMIRLGGISKPKHSSKVHFYIITVSDIYALCQAHHPEIGRKGQSSACLVLSGPKLVSWTTGGFKTFLCLTPHAHQNFK